MKNKALFLALAAALFPLPGAFCQEEPAVVKDLYPLKSEDGADKASDDELSAILDGLDLTDEERRLLEFPEADASEAGTDGAASQTAAASDEDEPEPASEGPSAEESQPEPAAEDTAGISTSDQAEEEKPEKKPDSPAGVAKVPPARRPNPIDGEKAKAAQERDEDESAPKKNRDTIRFGIPSEITSLLDSLMTNDDPRFTEEIYDLFGVTQNVQIQKKILEYFTKLEDPCLENFAVTVLNDPYDTRPEVVKACFEYVQKLRTKDAIPAVFTILESENETYFNDTLSTIGEIGDADSAVSIASYLDREDLSDAQRQTLMRTLGKLHAVETFDKITAILENEDENLFVRMYAAEALGFMGKAEAVPVLVNAFKDANPNLRQYAIKGLGEFAQNSEAQAAILQGIRDEHWKVRQESIKVSEKILDSKAIPYLEYRAENDSEKVIKEAAISALALYGDSAADKFLIESLAKKNSDSVKIKTVAVLLDAGKGEVEILALAEKALADVRLKNLAKGIGKELSKHSKKSFAQICLKYLQNKDADIVGLGLDMHKNCRMGGEVEEQIRRIATDRYSNATNKKRAKTMLGLDDENKD